MEQRRGLRDDPIELARQNWASAGWGDAVDGMAAVTSIMRVQQLMLSSVEQVLRPFGLTFARYEVLMLLHFSSHGSLPVGKIGERLQVHPASVTNAVDRLERDELVLRTRNPADGRGVLAAITPAGERVVDETTALLNEQVFTQLPAPRADLIELYELLENLRHQYGDF